nr:FGGY-family carbohydrate kinase [Maliibacterium massiliense]
MERKIAVALDIGNSGGKLLAAAMRDGQMEILDETVIENKFVNINGHMYWNLFNIYQDLKAGMKRFSALGDVVSIGVDATSGCYGFVNDRGRLAGQVASSRDVRFKQWEKFLAPIMTPRELYDATGVFPISGNNICKLLCEVGEGDLTGGMHATLLPLSGLMNFFLTGERAVEHSMAGASVLMDSHFDDWNYPLLEKLGIPTDILPRVVPPGTVGRPLLPQVAEETNCPNCRFVYTVEFDSSTAMLSAPGFNQDKIYLSMGTTINPGVEVPTPIINELAYKSRYKNVPVWPGAYMLLSDVTGFFIVSECLRYWNGKGEKIGHGELVELASQCQTDSYIDVFDQRFSIYQSDMPETIRAYCRETNQEVPHSIGEVARCLYESYALQLKRSILDLQRITGRSDYTEITIISGGSRNALLCQMISDASGMQVRAGNPFATAMGNLLGQFYALGHIDSLAQMRVVAEKTCPMKTYLPQDGGHFARASARIFGS